MTIWKYKNLTPGTFTISLLINWTIIVMRHCFFLNDVNTKLLLNTPYLKLTSRHTRILLACFLDTFIDYLHAVYVSFFFITEYFCFAFAFLFLVINIFKLLLLTLKVYEKTHFITQTYLFCFQFTLFLFHIVYLTLHHTYVYL